MTAPFTAHSKCRLCDSGNIEEVLDLGYSPLANAYLTEAQLAEVRSGKREEIFTPLRLLLCMECGSVQMAHSVDPAVLFTDYIYASSTSPIFVKHFDDFAKHVQELGLVKANDLVVDIGSNDGIALKAFDAIGCVAIGVEPSQDLASIAYGKGVNTWIGYWSKQMAKDISSGNGRAQLITATNVFAHLIDLRGFVEGVLELLADDGVFIFENSYLGDVVEHMLFDAIYMEHQFYHSLNPLDQFFRSMGMRIFRVERVPTHGGSVRVFVDRHTHTAELSSIEILFQEAHLSLPSTYRQFSDRLQCYKHRLHSVISSDWRTDCTFPAFGCPAKFTTFTYVLDLTKRISGVFDDSPLKIGRFTPGSHIPILSKEGHHLSSSTVLVSAWNFFDSIVANNKGFTSRWIRPLPSLEVIHV